MRSRATERRAGETEPLGAQVEPSASGEPQRGSTATPEPAAQPPFTSPSAAPPPFTSSSAAPPPPDGTE